MSLYKTITTKLGFRVIKREKLKLTLLNTLGCQAKICAIFFSIAFFLLLDLKAWPWTIDSPYVSSCCFKNVIPPWCVRGVRGQGSIQKNRNNPYIVLSSLLPYSLLSITRSTQMLSYMKNCLRGKIVLKCQRLNAWSSEPNQLKMLVWLTKSWVDYNSRPHLNRLNMLCLLSTIVLVDLLNSRECICFTGPPLVEWGLDDWTLLLFGRPRSLIPCFSPVFPILAQFFKICYKTIYKL